jgi:hypothetical protein
MKIKPFTSSTARMLLAIIGALVLIAVPLSPAYAAACTFTSKVTTGNWDAAGTWDAVGTACGTYPGATFAGDTVVIAAGTTVTVNVSPANTLGDVTINGTLNYDQQVGPGYNLPDAASLTVASGGTLKWFRSWTITGNTTLSGTVNFGSTSGGPRDMTFGGNVVLNSGAVWTVPASGNGANDRFYFGGSFTNNATTFTDAGTGIHNFTGTGSIGGTTATTFNSLTVGATTTNNSTLTVNTTLAGAGTLVNAATGTLNIGAATVTPTLTATAVGNVVNYSAAAAQTVKPTAYDRLILSGSGAKSVATGFTITNGNGNLSIAPTGTDTATLDMGTTNFTVSSLTLGGLGKGGGTTYGSVASGAAVTDNTYFTSTATGKLTVSKSTQGITFPTLGDKAYGDPNFIVSATASSGLPVVFSTTTTSVCTVTSGGTVTIVALGECTIDADQPGDVSYTAAPRVSRSFTVNKGNQAIDFGALTAKTYGDADFDVSATASSGLPVAFSTTTTTVCTVTGATVHLVAVGECTIDANQAGDSNYNPASQVSQGFTVNPKALTITADDATKTYGDTVTFLGTEFTTGALVPGDTVDSATLTSAGAAATATVTGSPYAIVASAAVGTGLDNYDITYVDGSLAVDKKALTITADDATKTYGDTVTFLGTEFTPTGLVNSDVVTSVALTSAGAGATATVTGSPYPIVASDAVSTGLDNYTVSYVDGSLTVTKASQTIDFAALANKALDAADFDVSATASSGLPVAFSTTTTDICTVTGSTVHLVAAGECTIDADQPGDDNYNSALRVSQSFTVGKLDQTISFAALTNKALGTADFTVSATASSSLPVSFSTLTTSVCTVTSGGTVHLVAVGQCTITADQTGDSTYNPAPSVDQSFNVLAAGAPGFSASPAAWGYGIRKIGTTTAKVFKITNNGTAALVITGVTKGGPNPGQFLISSNGCVTTVAAGGSCSLTVTYKPALKGPVWAQIIFADNAGGHKIAVSGKGGIDQLINGGFNVYPSTTAKIPTGWKATLFAAGDGKNTAVKKEGTASIRIGNTRAITKTLSETRLISGAAGTNLQLNAWIKGTAVPSAGVGKVLVQLYNGATLVQTQGFLVQPGTYGFTLKTVTFNSLKAFNKVVVTITYAKGSGTVWFDGMTLLRTN